MVKNKIKNEKCTGVHCKQLYIGVETYFFITAHFLTNFATEYCEGLNRLL